VLLQLREDLAAPHDWSERAAESLEHLECTLTGWTVRRDTFVTQMRPLLD
jgi:hypothetical protein